MNNQSLKSRFLPELVYPRLCAGCNRILGKKENLICIDCIISFPRTGFYQIDENTVKKMFWGRIPVEWAASFLVFTKQSRVQQILHHIKYSGMKELGFEMGKLFGDEIKLNPDFSDSVDVVVPVPLHPKKEKSRGYNQSEYIAKGIAEALNKPLSIGNLIREIHSPTQTKKSRFKRWENVKGIFIVKDKNYFENKHVLLIDDVITTGSTIEACYTALHECGEIKFSVGSLAYAHT